ncbi:MAG: hypothetical protein ABIJ26_03535, partial [Candidatus Margulisiibacteriota bacterium]
MDWTKKYDQKEMAQYASGLVDDLIKGLYKLGVRDLSEYETALLYRFSLHVAVNAFVERLLRVRCLDGTIMKAPFLPGYYATTEAAVNKFYYDRGLNSFLLISLADILSRPYTVVDGPEEADVGQTKKFNFAEIFRYLRRTVHNTATLASKPGVVGEWSHWMKNVLPA